MTLPLLTTCCRLRSFVLFLVAFPATAFVPTIQSASFQSPTRARCSRTTRLWDTELVEYLESLNNQADTLPCGLECSDSDRAKAAALIAHLIDDDQQNMVHANNGRLDIKDVLGDWVLLYTNSRTFSIVKSLNELEHISLKGSKFGGLTMKLAEDNSVEYLERVKDSPKNMTVSGEFQLQDASNSCIVEHLSDGTESTQDWSLIDILFLDKSLQISRGNVNTNSVFVWKKLDDA